MNHVKIAAALHALADAFLADVEAIEQVATGKKGKKAPAAEPTPTVAPSAASPAVAASVAVAPTADPVPAPPSVTLQDVNKLVLKVAAKNRDKAVELLSKFKLANTVGLAPDLWQPVYDTFEEEIAKMDAAAVQVATASLV